MLFSSLFLFSVVFSATSADSILLRSRQLHESVEPDSALSFLSRFSVLPNAISAEQPAWPFYFIELVSGLESHRLDEHACRIYFQALDTVAKYQLPVFREEVERLVPILNENVAKRWRLLAVDSAQVVSAEIKRFWGMRDDISSTDVNEALIRHWNRIYLARRQFTKVLKEPYQTDDRGIYWVKFGEPSNRNRVATVVSEVRDPFTNFPTRLRVAGIVAVEAEVWRYNLPEVGRTVVYYFGENKDENREFGVVSNLLDLVPTRQGGSIGIMGATNSVPTYQARNLLKFAAVQSLGDRSPETAQFYQVLEMAMLSQGRSNNLVRMVNAALPGFDSQMQNEFKLREKEMPKISTGKPEFEKMDAFSAQAYRLFDESGEPVFAVAITSSILRAERFEKNRLSLSDSDTLNCLVRFAVRSFDQNGVTNYVESAIQVDNGLNQHAFLLSKSSNISNMQATAEWFSENRAALMGLTLKDELFYRKALLSASGPQPVTYKAEKEPVEFQVSDIIVGSLNVKEDARRFPVIPVLKPVISQSDAVLVYFEVSKTPVQEYEVEVKITKRRSSGAKTPAINLNYRKAEKVSREYFEIPLSKLKKGDYVVNLTFRSGSKKVVRKAPLTIDF